MTLAQVPILLVGSLMIKSVAMKGGYAEEETVSTLLFYNEFGFESIEKYIAALRQFLSACDADDVPWENPEEALEILLTATNDSLGFSFFEKAREYGWYFPADPNWGPWTLVYSGYNAMRTERNYYVFSPEGDGRYIR